VAILSPTPYQYVRGVVELRGNARIPDQAVFRLKYGEGLNPSAWMTIGSEHGHQVDNGTLEYWDTTGLSGLYTIQLSVVDHNQAERLANVQVTVDNEPPQVKLNHPYPGSQHSRSDVEGAWFTIQVDAVDNLRMDRVEFYLDGAQVGISTVSPYAFKVMLSDVSAGQHEVWAIGFDAAGNSAETEHVQITVTG
jgi:hypothetical protein